MKHTKLTDKQQQVLNDMKQGWELGYSTSITCQRYWLQFGGIGKGGRDKTVNKATVHALERKGLIKRHYDFPVARYEITAKE